MIDPRTISRAVMLERMTRPDLSVVLLGGQRWYDVTTDDNRPKPTLQRVHAIRQGQDMPVGADVVRVMVQDGEAFPSLINRVAHAAIGRVLVLVLREGAIGEGLLRRILERFEQEAALGAVNLDSEADAPPPESADTSPCGFEGIAVRGDLWTALGGLDEGYTGLDGCLHDLFVRMRAIGFDAPCGSSPEPADVARLRARLEHAPDRSRAPATARAGESDPGKMAVFTALTNGYDMLKPQPANFLGGASLVAFLDPSTARHHVGRARGWRIVSRDFPVAEPRRASRFLKANAHLALPEARISLWIDASIAVVSPVPLAHLAAMFLSDADVCVFRHHARSSIAEEAQACKQMGLDREDLIDAQMDRYRREGFPPAAGLAELPVILRRHSGAVRALNEAWWEEILGGSHRDQLSFDYVAWKLGVPYTTFPLSLAERNGLFLKFRRLPGAQVWRSS